jgi:hypothetical protein
MLLKEFFDFFKVSYAIDTTFKPSLAPDDDCYRQDVRYSVEFGNTASPEKERVIYSGLDGQPPHPGSTYRRVCNADKLRRQY